MKKFKLKILQQFGILLKKINRGTSLVGKINEKFKLIDLTNINYDNIEIIFVIGTNGKTTSNNMLEQIFSHQGSVITNREGANLISGLLTTVIMNLNEEYQLNGDYLILEVDEKTLQHILKYFKPKQVLISNFFRDQLDRYGEIDLIIEEIIDNLNKTNAILYLNGNDPLICHKFDRYQHQKIYFGIEKHQKVVLEQKKIIELKYCPQCNNLLSYEYYHYGHIGKYACKYCDFNQHDLTTSLTIDYLNNQLIINQQKIEFNVKKFPIYLYFNLIGVYTMTFNILKMKPQTFFNILATFEFPKGRNQHLITKGKDIYLNLAKNVVGIEESLEYLADYYQGDFDLVIAFNDKYADGLDISWIWDADFSVINRRVNKVYLVGTRRFDMAVRIDIENFKLIEVFDSIDAGILKALNTKTKNTAIISNYTPLLEVNQIINDWKTS